MHEFGLVVALVFPSGDEHEAVVVAEGLAVVGLVLDAEVAAAAFFALRGVGDDEAGELEVVLEAEGFFEFGVHLGGAAGDVDVLEEVGLELFDFLPGGGEALFGASHAAVFPHDAAEGLVVVVDGEGALDADEVVHAGADVLLGLVEFGAFGFDFADVDLVGEVVLEGVGEDEVAVGQALHERAGAEAVGSVVGEVGFAGGEEAGDGGLQLVVDPEAAHGVVDGGVDHHGHLVGVLVGDFLVHLEEVAVLLLHDVAAEAADGVGEVEVDGQSGAADAEAGVAALLGGAAGHVARHEVAEGGVAALEVVVSLLLGDVERPFLSGAYGLGVLLAFGHPDAAVVAEAFAHEGELGLVVAVDGDAGGVDLDIAGVGEGGAAAVADPGGGAVAVHGVGGEVVDVAVAAGAEDDGVGGIALELAGDEVAGDDAAGAGLAVLVGHDDEVHHLVPLVEGDGAAGNLAAEGAVGAEEQLLAGLAAGVEGAAHLRAAEGAVVEQAAVVACEGYALCDALVDDVAADLGQAVDVGFAGAVVAALDGVFEEALHAVAVVLIVLGGVDAALCGDGVCAAGRVGDAEDVDVEAQGAERGGGRSTGQAGADDDDVELALVGGVDQLLAGLVVGPFFGQRAGGYFGVEGHAN